MSESEDNTPALPDVAGDKYKFTLDTSDVFLLVGIRYVPMDFDIFVQCMRE